MGALPSMIKGTNIIMAPHVVILGAGASRAAFPDGDKKGRKLPLMKDLVEILNLNKFFKEEGISYNGKSFEDLYDELYRKDPRAPILEDIQNIVFNYFSAMELPEEATIFDKLILCLRKKDLIASYNWDPLLLEAYKRNLDFGELPEIVFLHGNVAVGVCYEDRRKRYIESECEICRKYLKPAPLLYPIEKKDYNKEPFINSEWKILESYLEDAYFLTIFGYSAPKTDIAAKEIMKKIWLKNQSRELAEIDIIDLKNREELQESWKDFIVRSHYFTVTDFKYSYLLSRYPRRSCEGLFMATMQNMPWKDNPLPDSKDLDELKAWIKPLIQEEIYCLKEKRDFLGLPNVELNKRFV